jgi:hypothetical protein
VVEDAVEERFAEEAEGFETTSAAGFGQARVVDVAQMFGAD